jgi:hypothetical protein
MTSEMFWAVMLLGLLVQAVVIYGAIRLALVHDRALQARGVAAIAAKAKWKLQADDARRIAAEAAAVANTVAYTDGVAAKAQA